MYYRYGTCNPSVKIVQKVEFCEIKLVGPVMLLEGKQADNFFMYNILAEYRH